MKGKTSWKVEKSSRQTPRIRRRTPSRVFVTRVPHYENFLAAF